LDLNPDNLAAKIVVFKVLKLAKSSNDWETINGWIVKLDPKSLSTEPMTDSSGREGWSDQSLWYNYRINGLLEKGNPNEAILLVDEISERFPKQRKFFLRLKALAYYHLGNLPEAEKVYQNLCSAGKPDWWLLHEYARVIRDIGRKEDALKLMYKAANASSKLQTMVSLFEDIGILCKDMGKYEEAIDHLILCKNIRSENNWSIPDSVLDSILELNKLIENYTEPNSLKETLNICRSYWSKSLGEESISISRSKDKRIVRKELIGKVNLGSIDRPFCFIIAENSESFFCFKSDLPSDIEDGEKVTFNAIPSFDKKKNKDSWKASNIRYCPNLEYLI
jgi:tetratricopeptide (TPR) repeat protein